MSTQVGVIQYLVEIDTSSMKGQLKSLDKAVNDSTDNSVNGTNKGSAGFLKMGAAIGAVAGVAQALATKGIDLITKSIGDAVSRVDTLNNANRVFQNMGFSAIDTAKTMDELKKSILGLPTPLNEAVKAVQLIASSTGDIGRSQKIFTSLNNAILGFGGTADMVTNSTIQLSQAFSNGKIDAQTWLSLMNSGLGPALSAIAKKMGITTGALKEGLSDGTYSVKQFQDALIEMNEKGGGGMASFAQIAKDSTKGIATGMANAQTAITRGVAAIIEAIGTEKISGAISKIGEAFEYVLKQVGTFIKFLQGNTGVINKMFGTDIANANSSLAELGRALMELWDVLKPVLIPALKEWGKLLGVELVIYIKFTILALKTLADVLTFVADQITLFVNDTKKAIDDGKRALDTLKRAFSDTFESIKNAVDQNIKAVKDRIDGVVSTFDKIKSAVETFAQDIPGNIKKGLKAAAQALIDYDLDTLKRWKDNLDNTVKVVKEWATKTGDNIKTGFDNFITTVTTFFTELPQKFVDGFNNTKTAITQWIDQTWTDIKLGFSNFGQTISDFFTNLPQKFTDGFNSTKDSITTWFTTLGENTKDSADAAGKNLGDNVSTGFKSIFGDNNKMKQIGEAILLGIGLILVSLVIAMVDIGTRLAAGIITGINQKQNDLENWFRSLPGKFGNWISGAIRTMYNAGSDLIQGLINGINDKIGALLGMVKKVSDSITGTIKKILGIHSPSTVFAGFGENITQGLVKGINSGMGDVQSAVSGMGVGISPVVSIPNTSALENMAIDNNQTVNVVHKVDGLVVARSTSDMRDIFSQGIELVNQQRRARGQGQI